MPRLKEMTDTKLDKLYVHYTNNGYPKEHCTLCENWQSNNKCKIVHGKINPNGWCDRFEK